MTCVAFDFPDPFVERERKEPLPNVVGSGSIKRTLAFFRSGFDNARERRRYIKIEWELDLRPTAPQQRKQGVESPLGFRLAITDHNQSGAKIIGYVTDLGPFEIDESVFNF